MTSSEARPKPLRPAEVREIVLTALERGTYHDSQHARFDHAERMISINDVLFGLGEPWKGCFVQSFNEVHWQWKYRVETTDADGEPLNIIIAVDPKNKWFDIVTRFHD